MKTMKDIKQFLTFFVLAFLLLGVLFGMNIMTFIFAQLGPANAGLTVADVGYNESITVQNESLNGIVTYAQQSDTQFSIVSIAIILVILILVFILFWQSFIAPMLKASGKGSSANFGY